MLSTCTQLYWKNQLVVSRHFANDSRLSLDFLLVTADCQQTFGWWQPVITRLFAGDSRLSADNSFKLIQWLDRDG